MRISGQLPEGDGQLSSIPVLVGFVSRALAARLPGGQPFRGRRAGRRVREPVVAAPGAGLVLVSGVHQRLPVELALTDAYRDARLGTRLRQRLLHPEPGQPVGEEPDRLLVVEVGLPYPAL